MYVRIDGVLWAVPETARFVFQCHRGFWFQKERKPEIVKFSKTKVNEWTSEKELLHMRDGDGRLVPLRTAASPNWATRVFMAEVCVPEQQSATVGIQCV